MTKMWSKTKYGKQRGGKEERENKRGENEIKKKR